MKAGAAVVSLAAVFSVVTQREERCVTTIKTAARETRASIMSFTSKLFMSFYCNCSNSLPVVDGQVTGHTMKTLSMPPCNLTGRFS